MILSTCSRPRISSCAAPAVRARWSLRASVLYSTSLTSDDLPLPLTPVTATKHPSGMWTSTFFRLCCRAPRMLSAWPDGARAATSEEPNPPAPFPSGKGVIWGVASCAPDEAGGLAEVFLALPFREGGWGVRFFASTLRFVGTGIASLPLRYLPVSEVAL